LNNKNYRPDIDGLRALAVLAVVFFHAFPARMPGGFIGVDVFFVISGYLISGIIFKELTAGEFSFLHFYSRRARRIFPALFLVLLTSCVVGWVVLLADEYALLGKHVAAGAGFIQNLVLWAESGYFDQAADLKPLLHLWSLGVEEQFYIFWPLILWVLVKQRLNILAALLVFTALSFALCVVLTLTHQTAAFYSPLTRFWEFLLGAWLAWQAVHHPPPSGDDTQGSIKNWLSVLGLVLIAVSLLVLDKTSHFPGAWALLPAVGASLLIYAGPQAVVNRFLLANRWMVYCGLISYPLYLWHWPLLSFGRILENQGLGAWVRLALVVLAALLAWATYLLLERPIRLRLNKRPSVIWALTFLMVGIGGYGYWLYQQEGVTTRAVVLASASTSPVVLLEAPMRQSCGERAALAVRVPPAALKLCALYSSGNPTKTIVLWGDSTAISWTPVFLTIAKQKNYAVLVIAHPSCPPILRARKTKFNYEESKAYCADGKIQEEIIRLIRNSHPDLIVWLAAWSAYANTEFVTNVSGQAADQESTRQVLAQGLPETILTLADIARVAVMTDWPVMPRRPSPRVVSMLDFTRQPLTISRQQFDLSTSYVNSIFKSVQDKRVTFVNPAEKICDEDLCYSQRNGVLFYEDTYHILPQATMQFKDEVEAMFRQD
jgi:peptidoglycan/LPS O-acetylase OafA/YrhL